MPSLKLSKKLKTVYTLCNGAKSQINTIQCGVPQGSTLGPLLFSLYINNLPLRTKFSVNLFADDTLLTLKDKNIHQLQKKVNKELCLLQKSL